MLQTMPTNATNANGNIVYQQTVQSSQHGPNQPETAAQAIQNMMQSTMHSVVSNFDTHHRNQG